MFHIYKWKLVTFFNQFVTTHVHIKYLCICVQMCVTVCIKLFLYSNECLLNQLLKHNLKHSRNEETRGEKLYSLKLHCGPFFLLGVLVLLWLVLNRSLPNEEVFLKVFSQNHEISLSVPWYILWTNLISYGGGNSFAVVKKKLYIHYHKSIKHFCISIFWQYSAML